MAITKAKKSELLEQYETWFKDGKVAVIAEYKGLSVKNLDDLRAKLRENGGEFHIMKNTLARVALQNLGYDAAGDALTGSTAIAFGFEDAPSIAKAMADAAKGSEFLNIKAGYLGTNRMTASQVQALADLPPLPVMRAMLLGTILAPASQLVRTLAEPGRQIAAVVKAYADKEAASA